MPVPQFSGGNQAPEFPVNECWATVDGHRLRYLRCGSGPTLLMLHGLLGYSFSWRLNFAALARHFTVLAPDFLGTGYSDRPPDLDHGMRAVAERMLRFLDVTGVGQADILGTSHGGGVAAQLAALLLDQQPQRLRRLVLVAPVNPWSSHGALLTRMLATQAGGLLLRACFPFMSSTHAYFLGRMYGDPRRIPPGSAAGYSAPIRLPGTVDYALAIMRCWRRDLLQLASVYERLARVPTLLLWGTLDPAVQPSSAHRLHQVLADSQLTLIPGAGHLPYEETPEEFNRAVLEFLAN